MFHMRQWYHTYYIELTRPYCHLLRQEQPDVSHQTPQKLLIYVTVELYANG